MSSVNFTKQSLGVGTKSEVYQVLLNLCNFLHVWQAIQKLCLHKFKGQVPSICFRPSIMTFFTPGIYPLLPAYTKIEEKNI